MKTSISEGMRLVKTGEYITYFRPEKDLPEEIQYAMIQKINEIYDCDADENYHY